MANLNQIAKSIILVLMVVAVPGAIVDAALSTPSGGPESDIAATLKDYRAWTRVNDSPYRISPSVSVLCTAPSTTPGNPHADPRAAAFINVYANSRAATVMLKHAGTAFPVGSIIVKEKLIDEHSSEPGLLTVMIKRKPGYNPSAGDWEFAVLDGKGISVQARGRLANCAECHITKSKSDFIFGSYLTSK